MQQVLVEVQEIKQGSSPDKVAVGKDKNFLPYDQSQLYLMPPSLDEWVPDGHLARFVSDLVDDVLDLEQIYDAFEDARGAPALDPKMMVKLLIYGYATGTPSSRKLEERTTSDVAVRFLCANQHPHFTSICRFRRIHLGALAGIFFEALRLCHEAGLVKLGTIALDGTKVRASASRHKAMSYKRMTAEEEKLKDKIGELLAEAEATDEQEDRAYGADHSPCKLSEELRTKEGRLRKLREAKKALEQRSKQEAKTKGKPADSANPKPSDQRNFTDPDSKIMKTSDKSFHQCYNGQAAVDSDSQVIVATDLTNQAADCPHLPEVLEDLERNLELIDQDPPPTATLVADAGYFSEQNVETCEDFGVDPFIATGKVKHTDRVPDVPRGRIPASATVKERMARKLRTKRGRAVYAKRKTIVEPVFGQMQTTQKAKHVLLRGLPKARGEWQFHCGVHNLLKLHRAGGFGVVSATATGRRQGTSAAGHETTGVVTAVAGSTRGAIASSTRLPGYAAVRPSSSTRS